MKPFDHEYLFLKVGGSVEGLEESHETPYAARHGVQAEYLTHLGRYP